MPHSPETAGSATPVGHVAILLSLLPPKIKAACEKVLSLHAALFAVPEPIVTLRLPLAPSINAYYRSIIVPARNGRPARSQPILSAEGRQYVSQVSLLLLQQLGPGWQELDKPIRLEFDVYMERRGSDADNISKACQDSLQEAGVFNNDRQVCDLHIVRFYDRQDPRIIVRVYEETDPLKIDAIEAPARRKAAARRKDAVQR